MGVNIITISTTLFQALKFDFEILIFPYNVESFIHTQNMTWFLEVYLTALGQLVNLDNFKCN